MNANHFLDPATNKKPLKGRLQDIAPSAQKLSFFISLLLGIVTPLIFPLSQAIWFSSLLLLAALAMGVVLWAGNPKGTFEPEIEIPSASIDTSTPLALPATVAAAQKHADVMAELAQLRNVHQQLVQAKQEAEAAMMAKTEFLATMSHEIRTPLNGIIPLLDILMSTKLAPDQRDYLHTAYKSARELLRIVDDILDYSKIEASKLELESVGINLRDLTDSIRRLMEKNAEAKGLKINVQIDPSVRLAVRGDPVRLRQILSNLVSNAIKFTERGSVSIHVSRIGETRMHNEIQFAVKDTGIGITPESAEKLFQPFSQADTSTTRIHGGTGLGLVICKRIVDLMKGKMGVKSELGKGSIFWFRVPLLKAVGDLSNIHRDVKGSRVLLLTSDSPLVQRLSTNFNSWEVVFHQSATLADALSKLRSAAAMGDSWAYDVILFDFSTVRNNAMGLIRNLAREPTLSNVRCLGVTGEEEIPLDLQSEPRLVTLSRQFSNNELRAALEKLLEINQEPETSATPLTETTAPQTSSTPAPDNTSPLKGRILLVEDNPVNRQVAQRLIGLLGLNFVVAEDGKEAVEQMDQTVFDVVLMDCQMPIMDGYTATRTRRAKESAQGLPRMTIIAMTANAMAGDREKCLSAGMDDYMSKPLNRALLEQTLRKWLSPNAVSPSMEKSASDLITSVVKIPSASISIPPAGAKVMLDKEVLRELIEVMGEDFTVLVQTYLQDAPKKLEQLEQVAKTGEIAGLIAPAHSLKSTSANLGAMRLSEMAKAIEHGSREGTLLQPVALVSQMHEEFKKVAHQLNELLATLV